MKNTVVLVPVYNGAEALTTTLKSISGYTVIVVDNCSEEDIEGVCGKFDNVVYIKNKKNVGRVQNWNECLQHFLKSPLFEYARLAFAGDVLDMDEIRVQEDKMGDALLATGAYTINEGGKVTITREFETGFISEPHFRTSMPLRNFFGVSSVIFHKDLIKASKFDTKIPYSADYEFWLRLFKEAGECWYHSDNPLYTFNAKDRKHHRKTKENASELEDSIRQTMLVEHAYKYSPCKTLTRHDNNNENIVEYITLIEDYIKKTENKGIPFNFDCELRKLEYGSALYYNKPTKFERVLEVGSAYSLMPIMLTDMAKEVVCVDGNGYGGREKYREELDIRNLTNVSRNIQDLTLPKDEGALFDKAFAISTVEHTEDFILFQNSVRKHLRKGALYFISFDMMEHHAEMGEFWHEGRYFDAETVHQLVTEGFELVDAFVDDIVWGETSFGAFPVDRMVVKKNHDVPSTFGHLLLRAI